MPEDNKVPGPKPKPEWIHRRVEQCQCGHRSCKDWHVAPEANLQGVKFTKSEATQVGMLLDMRDRESTKPTVSTGDVSRALMDALADNLGGYDVEFFSPNSIVIVRADLLSLAHLEIEYLRAHIDAGKVVAAGIEGFYTRGGAIQEWDPAKKDES